MTLSDIRTALRADHLASEADLLARLRAEANLTDGARAAICKRGASLVRRVRGDAPSGLMEVFMAEYGLSTDEGIALMCLAEALLRVPDAETVDALIEDKIAPSDWGRHLGASSSSLVNASTWALMLTGRVLHDTAGPGIAATLRSAVRRLGEPVIRTAVSRAIRELGAQFVLGESIREAVRNGRGRHSGGFTYSYDMLGEAALTAADAGHFLDAYELAITQLAPHAKSNDIRENPGISVKLSALHPRYEATQRDRVMRELVASIRKLARQARAAGMGLNIDAEEADRLDLSLDVIAQALADPELAGWDGFGIVIQAYGKRCDRVTDWLYALAARHDRRIMVRLVKGAYWDTEIKRAQVDGLAGFPVFTRKPATDVAYICLARKLLGMTDRIYPQFATHNAHSVAAILEMAKDRDSFEFQRLHGMGAALHDIVMRDEGTRCRIYAPVGAHRDLLAYLVRRLLENGANSSFVNQIVNRDIPPEAVARDPFDALDATEERPVLHPANLFERRKNSRGWGINDPLDMAQIETARDPFRKACWQAVPLVAFGVTGEPPQPVSNPAHPGDTVGEVRFATAQDTAKAAGAARVWGAAPDERAGVLCRAADLYEARFGELFALLHREAGKTLPDAIAELREAVDFLRYYAAEAKRLQPAPRGVMACISPWNFPLAIFTGQISAALAAGNAVLAKPAEATCLVAHRAVQLLHQAGVPLTALQFLPGLGTDVGAALSCLARIEGLAFTGSTATAQAINRAMADHLSPAAPLIAETGGLNAMIVDSTALPEQTIRDIVTSSFRSAGQRCSAARILYLQENIAQPFLRMLFGAMDELHLGIPWDPATDVGPVIDARAVARITAYIDTARAEGRLLKELRTPNEGYFVPPAVLRVGGIENMKEEIFGPVLHVTTYAAEDLDAVVDSINASGYGLTFGMHTRIDDRVEQVTSRLNVGNIYINRNQIGAVVGSQPFGGEGLSGTGPKAGGPHYVARFAAARVPSAEAADGAPADIKEVQAALNAIAAPRRPMLHQELLPGPTGESNRLSTFGRGTVLCLGPTPDIAADQARIARAAGSAALIVCPGAHGPGTIDGWLDRAALGQLENIHVVALCAGHADARAARRALASRDGPIIPLAMGENLVRQSMIERHICIDTTAAGGNAALLAQES
ncbi:MAG: bifunctional proline dehydrogenase/L-glutamate gamma-semialdehyde dehydrogenase PutA [Rhodobacteraceae bacterium]|nr:bifunctional proline dehydrogenase/L-glutamate gamma-semialdehyde dehydrogenase PutA [Paracoccaceae bacterium]